MPRNLCFRERPSESFEDKERVVVSTGDDSSRLGDVTKCSSNWKIIRSDQGKLFFLGSTVVAIAKAWQHVTGLRG